MRLLFLALLFDVDAYFNPHFNRFLSKMYKPAGQKLLERGDFGDEGSFGGRVNASHLIRKQPVIIVHGVTNLAYRFNFVREFLFKHGYTDAEVFATTYGDGLRKFIIFVKLQCQYVRQLRALLQAVYYYTNSEIDVLAFSFGSPLMRKAILGGYCEGDYIGPALTHMIDTFVSIAGPNHGSSSCVVPFWICSLRNGLHCNSKFLKELNIQEKRYEGEYSFAIFSDSDDKVGVECCGRNCSSLPNSNQEIQLHGFDHDQIMVSSLQHQLSFIQNHSLSKDLPL